jgi:UMF1 family MFS transporter
MLKVDHFGSIRYAFFFLLAMLLIPLPILYAVDVDEGRAQAGQYAAEEAMK